jgi:Beta-propeller repeat
MKSAVLFLGALILIAATVLLSSAPVQLSAHISESGWDIPYAPFLTHTAGAHAGSRAPNETKSTLDPVLSYSTYLGGHGTQAVGAVNGAGQVCASASLFGNDPSPDLSKNSIFVPQASREPAGAAAVAIDSEGNCYFVGAGNITTSPGAFQPTPHTGVTADDPPQYVVKTDRTGKMIYATYLGGSGNDVPAAIAVDRGGRVYVTGSTVSNDFPTRNAFQSSRSGGENAFVSVLNSTGTDLIYSTYLGGGGDTGVAIAVDSSSNAYVAGQTSSSSFPLVSPYLSTPTGSFVAKFSPSGVPVYSTYFGLTSGQSTRGIAANDTGEAYLTGNVGTASGDAAFISKLNASGSVLLFSKFFAVAQMHVGGTLPQGIALDSSGNAYVAGLIDQSAASTLPLVEPIQSKFNGGQTDGFVTAVSSDGSSVIFSSFLGGPGEDRAGMIGLDSAGNIYLTAQTNGSGEYDPNDLNPFPILNAADGTYEPFVDIPAPKICGTFPIKCPQLQPVIMKIAPLSGPVLALPSKVDFQPLPQPLEIPSPAVPILFTNASSSGDIHISDVAITGDYSLTDNCPRNPLALSAATSCTLEVTFTPTLVGTRTGSITISGDAPGSPQTIELIGIAVPEVTLNPTALTFASQLVGTSSAAQSVTLTDTGVAFTITSITMSGDFAESNNTCGASLSPGDVCSIPVTFAPTSAGTRSGTLTIVDSAPGSPHVVALSGIGVTPGIGLGLGSGGSSSATVTAGQMASYSLSLGGAGMSGIASLSCTGAPIGASCSVPNSLSFSAASATPLTVTISTTPRNMGALRPGFPGVWWLWAVGLFGLIVFPRRKFTNQIAGRCYLTMGVMALMMVCSCGGNGSSPASQTSSNGTQAGIYTLTVTATSGATSQSIPLTLKVQ